MEDWDDFDGDISPVGHELLGEAILAHTRDPQVALEVVFAPLSPNDLMPASQSIIATPLIGDTPVSPNQGRVAPLFEGTAADAVVAPFPPIDMLPANNQEAAPEEALAPSDAQLAQGIIDAFNRAEEYIAREESKDAAEAALIESDAQASTILAQLQRRIPTLRRGVALAKVMNKPLYPYGSYRDGRALMANEDVSEAIKEAIYQAKFGSANLDKILADVKENLTGAHYNLVYCELVKDVNLKSVMQFYEGNLTDTVTTQIRAWIYHSIVSPDGNAMLARAGVSLAADVVGAVAGVGGVAPVIDVAVFAVFASLEVYRWCEHGNTDILFKNLGEHVSGCGAGLAGNFAGVAIVGAALGSTAALAAPGVILSLVLGLVFDFGARKIYRNVIRDGMKYEEQTMEEIKQLDRTAAATKAASVLDITNLAEFTCDEVHARFRSKILKHHPDKNINAGDAVKEFNKTETAKILGAWAVLRTYYDEVKNQKPESEGIIKYYIIKAYDAVKKAYVIVQAGFEELLNTDLNPGEERTEVVVYV